MAGRAPRRRDEQRRRANGSSRADTQPDHERRDSDERRAYKGRQVHRALEADIETNTGIECYFDRQASDSRRSTLAEELFAHELGHTLGLGHSSENGAESYGLEWYDGDGTKHRGYEQLPPELVDCSGDDCKHCSGD